MGRNAKKRRERKTEEKAKKRADAAQLKAMAPPDPVAEPEPPKWLRRTVVTEVQESEVTSSMASALFQISCSVTEGKDFDSVAALICNLAEVDAVILAHLVQEEPSANSKSSSTSKVRSIDLQVQVADVKDEEKEPGEKASVSSLSLSRLGEHTRVSRVSLPVKVDDAVVAATLRGEVVRIDDAPRDPVFVKAFGLGTSVGSMLALPLKYHGQVIGVLVALRREVGAFHDVGMSVLTNTADSVALDLAQSQLFREAITDPLTGMYGRQALMFLLRREVETARRYQFPLCLMMVDVDDLDHHNDVTGRKGGDEVLKEVAKRLMQQMRGSDIVVRFGGDEFLICMPQADLEQARIAAERVMASFKNKPVDAAGMPIDVAVSIGVAELSAEDRDSIGLMGRAEKAVSVVKEKGGGRVAMMSEGTLAVILHDDEDQEKEQKAHDDEEALKADEHEVDDEESEASPEDGESNVSSEE
ncbi:MAG: sensor domain-containing diguanylate cyclase [Deltaproteobacteria bacterium]|nr:sensor domain-containing diguanylate cyclase [Deltaproteobacteria bacterium]